MSCSHCIFTKKMKKIPYFRRCAFGFEKNESDWPRFTSPSNSWPRQSYISQVLKTSFQGKTQFDHDISKSSSSLHQVILKSPSYHLQVNFKSPLSHLQVTFKSSSSNPQVILKSSSGHPQVILRSSSGHPQVILKSSSSHS